MPKEHPFRYDASGFDGNVEHGCALKPLTGSVVLAELEETTFTYGKGEIQHMTPMKRMINNYGKKLAYFLICHIWSSKLFVIT